MKKRMLTVFAAALLLTGCGADEPAAPEVSGITETAEPAPVTALMTVTEPAETAQTTAEPAAQEPNPYEESLLHMTPEELLDYAAQAEQEPSLASVLFDLPDDAKPGLIQESASDRAAADKLAAARFSNENAAADEWNVSAQPELTAEKAGYYWCYRAYDDGGHPHDAVIFDRAFYDFETDTVNAEVTQENMKLLAAFCGITGCGNESIRDSAVFFCGDDGVMQCSIYALRYSVGDWGMSDQVALVQRTFSADMQTGKVTGYQGGFPNQEEELFSADIPGTYHEAPDIK